MENPDMNKMPKKQIFSAQIDLSKFEKATDEEKRQQDVMGESRTFFKDGMRKLMKNPLAVASIIVLICIILTIIIAPMIVPYRYDEILSVNGKRDKGAKNLAPFTYSEAEQKLIASGGERFPHILGTDEQCRDYFIRVIYGTRVSLVVGLFTSIIVLIIGMLYGSIAGYAGGKADLIMMRIVDMIYSLPDMLVVILLSVVLQQVLVLKSNSPLAALGTNMVSLFIVFGLLYWVGMARLIRAQILSQREQEYVTAAKAMGVREKSIVFRHILPNILSLILVTATLDFATCMLTESTLSYLGFGISPPTPTWGNMLTGANNSIVIQQYWWRWVFPALIFGICTICINLVGDSLRDAVDPKSNGR